jgi:hypothetical protein
MTKRINIFILSITLLITGTFILSFYFGWTEIFNWGTGDINQRGYDFFQIPRAFLNILDGRSMYDTYGGKQQYGPHSSWYVNHPAFAFFVGFWFSFFSPWTSYHLYTIYSYSLMGICFYTIQKRTDSFLYKNYIFLILMVSIPTYDFLSNGNSQAHAVLSITLLMVGVYDLTYEIIPQKINSAKTNIFIGLLISFFTKPIIILMLPMLAIEKSTRNIVLKSVIIYIIISFLFVTIPILNPQGIGLSKIFYLATHLDFVKQNMNIIYNNFIVSGYMKDNSIHWFNIITLSDTKYYHVDIFSARLFIDTILGFDAPDYIFKLTSLFCLILSLLIFIIKDGKQRLEAILVMIFVFIFSYFVCFYIVWEYQYSFALPIISMLFLLKDKKLFYSKIISSLIFIGIFICLPSFLFFVKGSDFFIKDGYHLNENLVMTIIHFNKAVPATIIFLVLICHIVILLKNNITRHI